MADLCVAVAAVDVLITFIRQTGSIARQAEMQTWFSKAVHTLLIASDLEQNNVRSIRSSSWLSNKNAKNRL